MPTRSETIAFAIEAFNQATYPDGVSKDSAWLGIYQTLLWYHPVNYWGYESLPHIIDGDKFRPAKGKSGGISAKPNAWVARAAKVHKYLAESLKCDPKRVVHFMNRLLRLPEFEGLQPHNSRGIAFAGLTKHILERFGPKDITYVAEAPGLVIFPGLNLPGRSEKPFIDVLATRGDIPVAVISTKWSLRHDRLSDLTNECPAYKSAFMQLHRKRGRPDLRYYVVTNEFDPARLGKLIEDNCIDGVVHVHKHAVTEVCQLDGRLKELIDLSEFVEEHAF